MVGGGGVGKLDRLDFIKINFDNSWTLSIELKELSENYALEKI